MLGCLVAFSDTSLESSSLVELPVMVAHGLNGILAVCPAYSLGASGSNRNCQSIVDVALRQVQPFHSGVLGDVPLGLTDWDTQLLTKPARVPSVPSPIRRSKEGYTWLRTKVKKWCVSAASVRT